MKRFWDKVKKTDSCWLWIAAKTAKGYGRFQYKNKYVYAHRFSWFLIHGYMSRIDILHHCDNPSCVNTKHLFEGTAKDNVQDAIKKGRMNHLGKIENFGKKINWKKIPVI